MKIYIIRKIDIDHAVDQASIRLVDASGESSYVVTSREYAKSFRKGNVVRIEVDDLEGKVELFKVGLFECNHFSEHIVKNFYKKHIG